MSENLNSSAMSENQNNFAPVPQMYTTLLKINEDNLRDVISYFGRKTYNATNQEDNVQMILGSVINLIKIDYKVKEVSNADGDLSGYYPSRLPIPIHETECNRNAQRTTSTIYEYSCEPEHMRDVGSMFNQAKFARCRTRFPMPVILYRGKYICRSSTLSGGPEIYGRSGYNYLRYGSTSSDPGSASKTEDDTDESVSEDSPSFFVSMTDWDLQLHDKVRGHDIQLLKLFSVNAIVDLMVENKKLKYGLYVTSSEKVDKENRYNDFNLIGLPYPGCEFFKNFRNAYLDAETLRYNWELPQNNASVNIPDDPTLQSTLKIDWNNYRKWNLITLTKNYLKYLLKYFQENSSGMLIHCISGWDRTPLYISLIRLSLWADGLIHQNLDAHQILYLTISYDWFLYGHHLCDRLAKGEDIFFFCFYFLKYITSQEFSITPSRYKRQKLSDKMTEDNRPSDSEGPVADVLLESELRGSNISLNSVCSSISTKSQETIMQTMDESNGNTSPPHTSDTLCLGASASPQSKRTSPVTVPSGGKLKRTESSATTSSVQSNMSCGSWQHVTSTGSVKGSDSSNGHETTSPNTILIEDELTDSPPQVTKVNRKERLSTVRTIFYKCFWATIGKDIPQYVHEMSISGIIEKVAEKVGTFSQRS